MSGPEEETPLMPLLRRVTCEECGWKEVTSTVSELLTIRAHYRQDHPTLDLPATVESEPVEPDNLLSQQATDFFDSDVITLQVDRRRAGVILLWGDESATLVLDDSLDDQLRPGFSTSPLLRALMAARLRWMLTKLEADDDR